MSEFKSIALEISDVNKDRRTAVIAHAVYDNIDRYGDISRKGMFSKSWNEHKASDIIFDIDHDKTKQPGKVIEVWEDEKKAYTKVSFGTHTLGNDTMLMMDEGIIRGASFEYITEKKSELEIKGRKIRELKEVRHLATTVTLALPPVNPLAGVVSVTKAQVDALKQFKAHVERLEAFCKNSSASDENIKYILAEVKAAREIINSYDTATTPVIGEPAASSDDNSFKKQLLLFNLKLTAS